jgi:hypothetical protein
MLGKPLDDPGVNPVITTLLATKNRMVFRDDAGNIETREKSSNFHHAQYASGRRFIESIPGEPTARAIRRSARRLRGLGLRALVQRDRQRTGAYRHASAPAHKLRMPRLAKQRARARKQMIVLPMPDRICPLARDFQTPLP